jgi:membrane protease YdiL (CAAX protease family)
VKRPSAADLIDPPYRPPPRDGVQRRLDRVLSDGWWLWLPLAVFLVVLFLGDFTVDLFGEFGSYVVSYVVRTLVVGGLLVWLWPRLMGDVQWTHLGLGAAVGVLGTVQWIGMDKLLLWGQGLSDEDSPWRLVFWLLGTIDPADGYNFYERIASPWLLVLFLIVRLAGPVLVVPVMEEVFWRNWLWRTFIAPNNYRLAKVGEYDITAVIVTSVAFAMVHPQRLIAVVYGLLMAVLLIRTKSLGSIILAHAVTNLLLGLYVLTAGPFFGLQNEWYFW